MNVTTEQELRDAIAASEPLIFIENDIDVGTGFVINYALQIESDGKAIRWTGANYQNLLRVDAAGSLALTHVTLDGMGKSVTLVRVQGGSCFLGEETVLRNVLCSGSGYAVFVGHLTNPDVGGSCTMQGSLITATEASQSVMACDGEVNMGRGARIAHTTTRAVALLRSTLNMSGDAAIEYNVYSNDAVPGVIAADHSVVNMGLSEGDAPVIAHNEAAVYFGGGAYVVGGSVMNMRFGAAIRDNVAATMAGGVGLNDGTLNMEDGAAITGNTSHQPGGGVFAMNGSKVRLSGEASIASNHADGDPGNGGGAYLRQAGTEMTVSESASITDNEAIGNGGGVYATEGAVVELSGNARIGSNHV